MPSVNLTYPIVKDVKVKQFQVTRTMTAGTDKAFVVPKNAQIIGYVLSGTASDAGTTAVLSIGTTSGTPTEHVSSQSVLAAGAGNGVNVLKGVTAGVGAKLTSDTMVYVKYAETGGASTTGSWYLFVLYVHNSSGQTGVYQ